MADTPFGAMLETAGSLQDIQAQRQRMSIIDQQQQAAADAAKASAERQQQFGMAFQGAFAEGADPYTEVPKIMMQFPDQAENIAKGWNAYQGAEKQQAFNTVTGTLGRLRSGDLQGAQQLIQQSPQIFRSVPPAILQDPRKLEAALLVQTAAFGKEGQDFLTTIGATPAAQLDRQRVELEYGKEEFNQWAKRQDIDIARMNAQINRETNEIKRDELIASRDARIQERDQAAKDRQSNFESKLGDIDNALMTITDIKTDPDLGGWFGATGTTGVISRNIPGTGAYDVTQKIKTLQSQSFLASIEKMKGFGQLTEAEGQRLVNSIGALEPGMSEKAFRAEIAKVENTLKIARARMQKQYGQKLPMAGSITIKGVTYSPTQLIEVARANGISVEDAKKLLGAQ